jgi:membrane protein implicated in regulation of membrane protease activity
MVLVWVLLAVAFLAAEAAITTAFFAFFLAIGCAAGAVTDLLGAPLWVQFITVGAFSIVGIAVPRKWLVRRMGLASSPGMPGVSMVGQSAITVDEVGDELHPGHAMLSGERWLAIIEDHAPLPPDSAVIVAAVRGTTLIVRPVEAATPVASVMETPT